MVIGNIYIKMLHKYDCFINTNEYINVKYFSNNF